MNPTFTASGIQIQTFDEIFTELVNGYREIYGQDINVEQDSPDGQRIGIETKARLDLQTFALYLSTQLDPDTAIGHYLNTLIKFTGITRRPATRSQVDVIISSDRPLILPIDFTVQDALGQNWLTDSEVSINAGQNPVTLFAENFGAVEALPNTVNNIITIVLGVSAVNNDLAALVGQDEETDEELRIRRNKSLESAAYSTVGGLFAKLDNLPGVTDLAIYENDTKTDDPETGIPANSIWVIIEGGSVSDITETIVKNKTAGTGMMGNIETTYTENIPRSDGSFYQIPHTIRFDRPEYNPLYIRLTVRRRNPTIQIDLDLIKASFSDKQFEIGQSIRASELYCNVYDATTGFTAYDLEISNDGTNYTDEILNSALNEKFVISKEGIDITEVIS